MKYFKNFSSHMAKHLKVKYYWNDLRENPRYARYGILSALLAICVTTLEYYPLPPMGYQTLMWLFGHPVMITAVTLALGCGYTLAFLLGLVGLLRPALTARSFGIVGVLISGYFMDPFLSGIPLWQEVLWEMQWLIDTIISFPSILVYEYTGGNETLGIITFVTYPLILWIIVRKRVFKYFG